MVSIERNVNDLNNWNKKNALRITLYSVLYFVGTLIVCVLGAVHPIMFVCYQVTAALLLTGLTVTAFDKVRSFGAAFCFSACMIIALFVIQDASLWHCIPLIAIAVIAEIIRAISKYSWKGDVIAAVVMSYSSFGYYGQIWFNRAYTYQCAVEEMPEGYADSLMALSPVWALPLIIIAGIVISIVTANLTARIFGLDKERNT